jgi:hypothetical protein
MDKHILDALDNVVEYLWEKEQRNYLAEDNPKGHIFEDLMVLDNYLIKMGNKKNKK